MPSYKSAITPETLAVEVIRPSLGGRFSNPVAQFITRDKTNPNHMLSTSVHVNRKDALLAAADLIELAGLDSDPTGEVVTELRKQAYVDGLKVLKRGDFVRLVSPPDGNEKHGNAVVVVTDPTRESPHYADSFLTVLIPGDGFLQVQRKELGQPLDYDDDGEKLIIG